MAQALYRKWRPQTFDEVVGQDHVVRTLRNALLSGRIHHAYLFAGPRGTGKTTTARLLAKAVNCLAPDPAARPCNQCAICRAIQEGRLMDLIEIDAASNTSVEDVRELRERVGYRPTEARYKVYIIDEVHMLSTAAFNALLKTLEEPPAHVIFVLATTEPHRIPATVLSRCQRLDFRRIPLTEIASRLRTIAERENIQAEEAALMLIARHAAGSMRDAESLLDQLAAYGEAIQGRDERTITVETVRAVLGTGDEEVTFALTDALASGDIGQGLRVIQEAVDRGTDPRQLARQMAEHLRALLLAQLGATASVYIPEAFRSRFQEQAAQLATPHLTRAIRLFNQAATETRTTWQPQLPLELAFVEAVLAKEGMGAPGARSVPVPQTGTVVPQPTSQAPTDVPQSTAPKSAGRLSVGQPFSSPTAQPSVRPSSPSLETPPSGRPLESPASAPPTSVQSPVTPEERPEEDALSLEEVRARWNDFLQALRSVNLSLQALLRSGRPVGVEGRTVLIGFAYPFHKSKVEEDTNRRAAEDVLSKLLGRRVKVRCVLSAEEPAPTQPKAPRATPARPTQMPSSPDDPLVQAAVEKLGARVKTN
ncbi:MAG: DNA polymerase III subunit gamma/tau [Anaerolineae bacterium]|nr:DNA polymerase III subunit gamma/tau [Anaerolineae bacterium]